MVNKKLAVKLLRKTRVLIATHRTRYICFALRDVYMDCGPTRPVSECKQYLKSLIETRLEKTSSLEAWLIENEHVSCSIKDLYVGENNSKMNITRLAWIDSLIEEFS